MSRLGRGGGGIGARMRGQALPFDIDPELVEAADKSLEDEFEDDSDKEIFPVGADKNLSTCSRRYQQQR